MKTKIVKQSLFLIALFFYSYAAKAQLPTGPYTITNFSNCKIDIRVDVIDVGTGCASTCVGSIPTVTIASGSAYIIPS